VLTRHACRVQVVTQSSAYSAHFVCGQLLALTTSAKHNAKVCLAVTHMATNGCTNWWVVTTFCAVRSEVNHIVSLIRQQFNEVLFEGVAGVVGTNCYA
jgi:hypothetical protein